MNTNLLKRTLTCILGIPVLAALIFLIPQHHFLGLSVLMFICSLLGSLEMSKMLFGKVTLISGITWILPLLQYLYGSSDTATALLLVICSLAEIINTQNGNFENSINNFAKNVLLVIYPSFLATFVIKVLTLPFCNSHLVMFFLLLVFSNDIFAYVFGMLFGKTNAGIIKVSPKKSIAGFVGGFVSCIVICLLYSKIFTGNLPYMNIAKQITLAALMSITANIGDLAESIIKRGAKVKDSGNIIPGRGGILDSMDSILTSAPLFCFFLEKAL